MIWVILLQLVVIILLAISFWRNKHRVAFLIALVKRFGSSQMKHALKDFAPHLKMNIDSLDK